MKPKSSFGSQQGICSKTILEKFILENLRKFLKVCRKNSKFENFGEFEFFLSKGERIENHNSA